jgi:hypothetical protein
LKILGTTRTREIGGGEVRSRAYGSRSRKKEGRTKVTSYISPHRQIRKREQERLQEEAKVLAEEGLITDLDDLENNLIKGIDLSTLSSEIIPPPPPPPGLGIHSRARSGTLDGRRKTLEDIRQGGQDDSEQMAEMYGDIPEQMENLLEQLASEKSYSFVEAQSSEETPPPSYQDENSYVAPETRVRAKSVVGRNDGKGKSD